MSQKLNDSIVDGNAAAPMTKIAGERAAGPNSMVSFGTADEAVFALKARIAADLFTRKPHTATGGFHYRPPGPEVVASTTRPDEEESSGGNAPPFAAWSVGENLSSAAASSPIGADGQLASVPA